MAQFGRALALGARGRRFKSCLSDQCRVHAASMFLSFFSILSVSETAAGYPAEPLLCTKSAGHRFRSPERGVRIACCAYYAGLAQLAEHLFCSQGVMGSSPLFGSMAAHSRPVLSPYRHIPRVVHSFYCVVHPYGNSRTAQAKRSSCIAGERIGQRNSNYKFSPPFQAKTAKAPKILRTRQTKKIMSGGHYLAIPIPALFRRPHRSFPSE